MTLIIIRIFSASFGMLRLATERIWKHVDDGNGRKFVIATKGNACSDVSVVTRKHTRFAFLYCTCIAGYI